MGCPRRSLLVPFWHGPELLEELFSAGLELPSCGDGGVEVRVIRVDPAASAFTSAEVVGLNSGLGDDESGCAVGWGDWIDLDRCHLVPPGHARAIVGRAVGSSVGECPPPAFDGSHGWVTSMSMPSAMSMSPASTMRVAMSSAASTASSQSVAYTSAVKDAVIRTGQMVSLAP